MLPYRIDILTLFPNAFDALNGLGVIGRAFSSKIAELYIHNPRDFTTDKYRKVDDQPYGGGVGMIIRPEPIFAAFESIPKFKKLLSKQFSVDRAECISSLHDFVLYFLT